MHSLFLLLRNIFSKPESEYITLNYTHISTKGISTLHTLIQAPLLSNIWFSKCPLSATSESEVYLDIFTFNHFKMEELFYVLDKSNIEEASYFTTGVCWKYWSIVNLIFRKIWRRCLSNTNWIQCFRLPCIHPSSHWHYHEHQQQLEQQQQQQK